MTDEMIIKQVFPVKILRTAGSVTDKEKLLQHKVLQTSDTAREFTYIKGRATLLVDFGKEVAGGLRILIGCGNKLNYTAKITFGESVSEALSTVTASTATNDHSPREVSVTLSMLSDVVYASTGFRYVNVAFQDADAEFQLIAFVAQCCEYGAEKRGYFRCSDERLNRIYDTAVYTVQLCLQNGFLWDGIKRDRMVWTGDLNPEIKTLCAVYGDCPNIRSSLDFVAGQMLKESWINNIPSYSMWWIVNLYDLWFATGDQTLLNNCRIGTVEAILNLLDGAVTENGDMMFDKIAYTQMPFYFDWPSYGSRDAVTGVKAHMKRAVRAAEALLQTANRDTAVAGKLLAKIGSVHYGGKMKQIAAACALSGDESALAMANIIAEERDRGFSTFQSYAMLKAMACGGKTDEAVEIARSYFGKMLDLGATTFWEDFDADWFKGAKPLTAFPEEKGKDIHADFGKHCYTGFRHSLCHGWASGVAAFLMEYVAGVRFLTAGGKAVAIEPCMGKLQWLECAYPTRYGVITVSAEHKCGKINVRYTLPEGVIAMKE